MSTSEKTNTAPTKVSVSMVRPATMADIPRIKELIDFYAEKELMLPRPLHELYPHLRDYYVCEDGGEIIGCVGLRMTWNQLAEVISLAVAQGHERRGVGQAMVQRALDEAKALKIKRVFALTYVQAFFEKLGFKVIDKVCLPHKVWNDCTKCNKFPECDEIAVALDFSPAELNGNGGQ